MNYIEVINELEQIPEIENIHPLATFALKYMKVENAVMNIIFITQDEIKKINKEYRNIDSVTDVISFALEDDSTFVETEYRILGDIYICLDRAKHQARDYNHSLKREICFLTIHGILHLLGYDHITEKDEKIMFKLQEEILNEFGIKKEN